MERIYKGKSKLNLCIDIIMLLLLMPIAGIGFMIKYVLIPGIFRNVIYGNNVDLAFIGLGRHQWGTIHLILSLIFLALLFLHIVLHWRMISGVFSRMIPNKILRIVLTILLATFGLILISFPLVIKPEIIAREPLHQNRNNNNVSLFSKSIETNGQLKQADNNIYNNSTKRKNNSISQSHNNVNEEYKVYGSETLQFVAAKYNVSAYQIAADLKIPKTLTGEKLGRLKKLYSFTMDDVRRSISKFRKTISKNDK